MSASTARILIGIGWWLFWTILPIYPTVRMARRREADPVWYVVAAMLMFGWLPFLLLWALRWAPRDSGGGFFGRFSRGLFAQYTSSSYTGQTFPGESARQSDRRRRLTRRKPPS